MTAAEVIEQIEKMPREERAKVIEFVRSAAKRQKLSPEEVGDLCERMQNAKNPDDADRLEQQLIEGFYGEGELVKTVLTVEQAPTGTEIE